MFRRLVAIAGAGALSTSALLIAVASPASSGTFPGTNCKIAYVHNDTQTVISDLFLMNADGTGKTNLTNLSVGSVTSGPTWSPDGTKLAYSLRNGAGIFELVVMNGDGSGQTTIDSGSGRYFSLTYSPDGTKIAFTMTDGIYVINADGTSRTKIVNDTGYLTYSGTQFAPNGRLAYRDSGLNSWTLINADGTGATAGTWSASAEELSFSPDGTRVLYAEYQTTSTDMYVSNLDGSGVVLISTDTNGYEDEGQSWSPDGTKTVWTQEDPNTANYQVMLSNPDGSGLVDLTQEPTAINTEPAWGPGGAGTPCAAPSPTTTAAPTDPSTPKFTG